MAPSGSSSRGTRGRGGPTYGGLGRGRSRDTPHGRSKENVPRGTPHGRGRENDRRGVCRKATTAAKCPFKNCKFRHTDDPVDKAEQRPKPASSLSDWQSLLPKEAKSCRPLSDFQLTMFFKSASGLVLENEDSRQTVVESLASDGGLARIKQLVDLVSEQDLPEDIRKRHVLDTFIPFCEILACEDVSESWVLEDFLRRISNFVFGAGLRAGPLFQASFPIIEGTCFSSQISNLGETEIKHFESFLAAFAWIAKFNQDAIAIPALRNVAEALAQVSKQLPESALGTSAIGLKARGYLVFISRRFQPVRNKDDGEANNDVPCQHGEIATESRKASFVVAEDGPGNLSEEGPRHDNDHEDISQIQILPTQAEILSTRRSYLPRSDLFRLHLPGIKGVIDRQFRLLREDTVGQLRDAVKDELDRHQARKDKRPYAKGTNQGAFTYVYKYGAIVGLDPDDKRGLRFTFSFAQPEALKQLPSHHRHDWWQRSKRLSVGSLVCLIDTEGHAMFAEVISTKQQNGPPSFSSDKVDEGLYRDPKRASVALALIDSNVANNEDLFRRVSGPKGQDVMVEFNGVLLASFAPTLTALKGMVTNPRVPFADVIAPTERHTSDIAEIEPPEYTLSPGFSFDLSPIMSDGEHSFLETKQPFDVVSFRNRSTFDEAQANAVINALSRRLALIQGPPGTGKSYTGIALMKVLLHNQSKARLGPILVVTYTNHALDQQLEHLVRAGIGNIVRIGSRSKSEILQDVNIRELRQKELETNTEKGIYHRTRNICRTDTKEIKKLIQAKRNLGNADSLSRYLGMTYPHHREQLFAADAEGFTAVISKNHDRIRGWLNPRAEALQHLNHDPRPLVQLKRANLWGMTLDERKILYDDWVSNAESAINDRLIRHVKSYIKCKTQLDRLRQERDIRILRQAKVIGATTSGLANVLHVFGRLSCKVLLCEEAGEVLEAHTLTALLPSIEHAILIGDHLQLRPSIQNYSLSCENRQGEAFSLNISLFERLVDPRQTGLSKLPLCTLWTQRRMHPSISELVRSTLYSRLEDQPSVKEYPAVEGMRNRLYWLDHRQFEAAQPNDEHATTTRTNTYEVKMTAALVSHLVKQGVYESSDIAVLTPYLGQLTQLRRELGSMFQVVLDERDVTQLHTSGLEVPDEKSHGVVGGPSRTTTSLLNSIRVATVDNFQGEEAKVVIISLVRSNAEGNCGFLKTSNRMNVLLSRAMHGMYIFGNPETVRSTTFGNQAVSLFEEQQMLGPTLGLCCPKHPETPIEVSDLDDFITKAPEGGCDEKCNKYLTPCGHPCPSSCHSQKMHDSTFCPEPCMRTLPGCGHGCPKACGEQCPARCTVLIEAVSLPCGHTPTLQCWQVQSPTTIQCPVNVEKVMNGCGHTPAIACWQKDERDLPCKAQCAAPLACGHLCLDKCFNCRPVHADTGRSDIAQHGACKHICKRDFSTCRHSCQSKCHGTQPCPPCQAPCEVACAHGRCSKKCSEPCSLCAELTCDSGCKAHGRSCSLPCSAPCDWVPCSERCQALLSCGHQCPSICCEPCPTAEFCQLCAPPVVKNQRADLLTMESYAEVDLAVSPVIVLPCKHIFTVESLDGLMDIGKYYELDASGHPVAAKNLSPEPLSVYEPKDCPDCRFPLRSIKRYSRIVRGALTDQTTKKFIVWSNSQYVELSQQVQLLEAGKPDRKLLTGTRLNVILENGRDQQISVLKRHHSLSQLLAEELKLRGAVAKFAFAVKKEEQPLKRVHDMVQYKRRQGLTASSFSFPDNVLQTRSFVLAYGLLLRCDLDIIATLASLMTQATSTSTLILKLDANRQDCEKLVEMAEEATQPREQVEGHVLLARYAALERSTGVSGSSTTKGTSEAIAKSVELRTSIIEHLDAAEALIENHPGTTRGFTTEIEDTRRMAREATFFTSVTSEEKLAVLRAMAVEFQGTGHWYTCENGHPFTIGECGAPMQTARCPQCGATIGGQRHEYAAGVTRAHDFDTMMRDMRL